ncbi:unnamed protein product [Moneuplotes crassus]|uniref:Sfi1 spindle body domain-containing protein n=1 Tax=Euplotes crassus TaxID=5936 RepID=A0AAD1X9P1_EUPCR|nr:unnamed protein product [Moneuplotes crassus]
MEDPYNFSRICNTQLYDKRKMSIVQTMLKKAYDIKYIQSTNTFKRKKSATKLSQRDFGKQKAMFSMDQEGKQLVLEVSLELGVPLPEVMDAYEYIVKQANVDNSQDRKRIKAIIFDKKRLMRKTFRSIIYYCYGGFDDVDKPDIVTDFDNDHQYNLNNVDSRSKVTHFTETLDQSNLQHQTRNLLNRDHEKQKQSRNKSLIKKYNSMNSLVRGFTTNNTFASKNSMLNKSAVGMRTKSQAKRLDKSVKKSKMARASSVSSFLQHNPETAHTMYPQSSNGRSDFLGNSMIEHKNRSTISETSRSRFRTPASKTSKKRFTKRSKSRKRKMRNKLGQICKKIGSSKSSVPHIGNTASQLDYPQNNNLIYLQPRTDRREIEGLKGEDRDAFIKKWYQAYCYREEILMRKALFILHKFKEQNQKEIKFSIQVRQTQNYNLVKNAFYTWVKKYQYRVTRRPLLIKSLTFWGNNVIRKGFTGLKQYRTQIIETRKKLRTFWCIRAAVAMIENISMYDKNIYPSQAMNLPIKNFNEKELEITVKEHDRLYKKKLFETWKEFYFKIREKKAKIAYNYVNNTFQAWKEVAKKRKLDRQKIQHSLGKCHARALKECFSGMKEYLDRKILLNKISEEFTTKRGLQIRSDYFYQWVETKKDKQETEEKTAHAEEYYRRTLLKRWFDKIKHFSIYKTLVRAWFFSYREYKEDPESGCEDEDLLKMNSTLKTDHNIDCSIIQEVQKINCIFTDDGRNIANKPLSFLDDTILSTSKKSETDKFKYCSELQKTLLIKIDNSVQEMLKLRHQGIVEAIYNKLIILDTREEKILLNLNRRKRKIFTAWINFTDYCKESKAKVMEGRSRVEKYKLKVCFQELKKVLTVRDKRLQLEQKRKYRMLEETFFAFKHVIRKSMALSDAYCEVASKYRQQIARECLEKWYYETEQKIQARMFIKQELEEQRRQEIYTYHLHIMGKAFEALKINMAPRTITLGKLVERYNSEKLKSKTIKSLKICVQRRHHEEKATSVVEHNTKLKYFKCWLMLYNELNISKSLRTPFVNLQKQAYEEDWSLAKLNMNTEKVYSCLSYGRKKAVFASWKNHIQKLHVFQRNTEIVQKIQNKGLIKKYFNLLLNIEFERKQARMVNSYMAKLADENNKMKYIRAWKRFVLQSQRERQAHKEAEIIHNQKRKVELEKEKRDRQRELAEKANKIRNQMIQKACFEALRSRLDVKKDLENRCNKYIKHRKQCMVIEAWNNLWSLYDFKQKEKNIEHFNKRMLFRRAVKMFNVYKTQKVYWESLNEQSDYFREMNLLKNAFITLKSYTCEKQYEKELSHTADLYRKKKMMRRWRRAYLNINIAKTSFEVSNSDHQKPQYSINDIKTYKRSRHDMPLTDSFMMSPVRVDSLLQEKGKSTIYKSMVHEAIKENINLNQ